MLRASASILMCCFAFQVLSAQTSDDNPVAWEFSIEQQAGAMSVLAKADVADGWYVYSQFLEDGGPIATVLDISETPGITLTGKATETGDQLTGYDQMFDMQVTKFKSTASFSQVFELSDTTTPVVGSLLFMACTDKKCLPPRSLDIALSVGDH